MSNTGNARAVDILQELIKKAKKAGANAADAMLVDSAYQSVGYRVGKVESLERAESGDLGLRVFVGKQQASVSTTDRRSSTLDELVDRAVSMAKLAPEDVYSGIADPSEIAKIWPEFEMADTFEPQPEQLIATVRAAEEAALAVKGVTNSEGAEAGFSASDVTFVASNGFEGSYRRTNASVSASIIAGDGTAMERDYDYSSRVFWQDMPKPEEIGKRAGERAVKRLNARKMPTMHAPIIFDPRISNNILGTLSGAISGASIARGTSFLKDMLGKKIFPESITVIDDPFRARGLRSRPFDGEGLLPEKRKIIDHGVLTTWLLDLRSARQLSLKSTAHASRSPGGVPSPSVSNFYMEPGKLSPVDLMRDIKQGFYVTELMGMGVNGVTGDYSQAAAGFWIEDGEIAFPVNEMTIASNLKDMYAQLSVASDLEFTCGIDAATIRIENMTIAGV
jgi:PmbA protein